MSLGLAQAHIRLNAARLVEKKSGVPHVNSPPSKTTNLTLKLDGRGPLSLGKIYEESPEALPNL